MSEELETAQRYRLHAEGLRLIAEGMGDQPNRRILLDVANDYDRMARSLEAIERRNRPAQSARLH